MNKSNNGKMNENERKNNGRSETMKGSRLMKETMGK
jgi:hypothetical protein